MEKFLMDDEQILWKTNFFDIIGFNKAKRDSLIQSNICIIIGFFISFYTLLHLFIANFNVSGWLSWIMLTFLLSLIIIIFLFSIFVRSNKKLNKHKEDFMKSYYITDKRIIDNTYSRIDFSLRPSTQMVQIEKNFFAININVIVEIQVEYYEEYFDMFIFFEYNLDPTGGAVLDFIHIPINEKEIIKKLLIDKFNYQYEEDKVLNQELYFRDKEIQ